MGCDGGTIPKRKEIVKEKKQQHSRDKEADLSSTWQFCHLTGLRLKKPIVACQLGHLYNKDSILEHLLDLKTSKSRPSSSKASNDQFRSQISHIRSLKDVTTLNLKEKYDRNEASQVSSVGGQFVCSITGLELNGKYKFYFLLGCGCVFSERALRQVSAEKQCIICSKSYDPNLDLIVLNGQESEIKELKEKLAIRRRNLASNKSQTSNTRESRKKVLQDELKAQKRQRVI